MALQPLTQLPETSGHFEDLLADVTKKRSRKKDRPRQMAEKIARFEEDVSNSERLVEATLAGFVDFVREAGQDDDAARRFDEWTAEFDLTQTLAMCEEKMIPGLKEHAAILRKVARGWKRRAKAGDIEPELPPKLAKRVKRLDARIKGLTDEITKQHDNDLVARLLMRIGKQRQLTLDEQLRLVDAVRLDWKVKEEPSVRRADWYGDDGR